MGKREATVGRQVNALLPYDIRSLARFASRSFGIRSTPSEFDSAF